MLEKRSELIGEFIKNSIISKNGKFFDAPEKTTNSITEKKKGKPDRSIPKRVEVSDNRLIL